jgi:hypothetical protein
MSQTLLSQRKRRDESVSSAPRGPLQRRFMRRLSVGVKLWITTGILALPLLGLGIFYVQSLTSTLWFSASELKGVGLYKPLYELANDLGRHSEHYADLLAGNVDAQRDLRDLEGRIDGALARFDRVNALDGNTETLREAHDLRQKWQQLKARAPANLGESIAAHAAVLDSVEVVRNQVSTDWLLILDPSATAAKEIKTLIEDSSQRVADGSSLVANCGDRLQEIVVAVQKVSDIVAEIATASSEQSSGIEQVNGAVVQMDQTTQQNAALVEEVAAASQNMAARARELNLQMSSYKLRLQADCPGTIDRAA